MGFKLSVIKASFTDRGAAALGMYDRLLARLFEPLHQVHLTLNDLVRSCGAEALVRVACRAANLAASSDEFLAFLTTACPSVRSI